MPALLDDHAVEPRATVDQTSRRIRRAGQARSALTWGLGGFLFLQVGLIIGLNHGATEFRDLAYAQKLTRLRHRTANAPARPFTVVMLGSSRTVFGLKAGRLEKPLADAMGRSAVVFNFAMYDSGPLMNLVTLRRMLADHVRPDLLLLEVLPPALTDKPHTLEVNRIAAEQLGWEDVKLVQRFEPDRRDLSRDWRLSYPVPWYSHRFAIVSRFAPGFLPLRLRLDYFSGIDDSGSVEPPAYLASDTQRAAALQKACVEYADYLSNFRLGGPPCQALRATLEVCRKEKIPVALVLMPEGTQFRSWYQAVDWERIEQFLVDLSDEFAAPVINAREWIADDDFIDSHHLRSSGAVKFTDRLGREILPGLVEPQTANVDERR
jgi:hypothetical protein